MSTHASPGNSINAKNLSEDASGPAKRRKCNESDDGKGSNQVLGSAAVDSTEKPQSYGPPQTPSPWCVCDSDVHSGAKDDPRFCHRFVRTTNPNFTPSPLTFHPFPRLPQELQGIIWKIAANDLAAELSYHARLCSFAVSPNIPQSVTINVFYNPPIRLAIPALLHVTTASRSVLYDTLLDACIRNINDHFDGWHRLPGNFKDVEAARMGGLLIANSGYSLKRREEMCTIIRDFRLGPGLVRRLVKANGEAEVVQVCDADGKPLMRRGYFGVTMNLINAISWGRSMEDGAQK